MAGNVRGERSAPTSPLKGVEQAPARQKETRDGRDRGSGWIRPGLCVGLRPTGGAPGIAVVGEVFFSQLTGSGGYGHAFAVAAVLQVALLAASAVVAVFLPGRKSSSRRSRHAIEPNGLGREPAVGECSGRLVHRDDGTRDDT